MSPAPVGPLEGIRILDLTRVMAGPFASLMLGDLGADVIKVETTLGGDVMRHMGGHHRGGVAALYAGLNRGKQSLALDFRDPGDLGALHRLADRADVVLENFRPGVCASMGLSAEDLRATNPRLIYCSINGYGSDSPASADPAYDTMVQGRSGMVARQRKGPTGAPDLVRSFLADKVAAFFAVQAVVAALFDRERHGTGATVTVPMLDAALYYLWPDSMTDVAFVGEGVSSGTIFPLGMTLTSASDGYFTHLALSDKERAGVNRAIGRPDLTDDPRFATTAASTHRDNLVAYQKEVAAGFARMTTADALTRLRREGVPCSEVKEPQDVLTDPHVVATHVLEEWEHPSAGRMRHARFPVRFDGAQLGLATGVSGLGEDNAAILPADDWPSHPGAARQRVQR